MRPERVKRPPTAADGTVLSGLPAQKKTRIEVAVPVTTEKSPYKASKKAKSAKVSRGNEVSSAEEEEAGKAEKSIRKESASINSSLSLLDQSTLEKYLPEARNRVLSILSGQLPPLGLDENGRLDGSECIGLQDQWLNLRAAIRGTLQGEGNSALLVGAKGSGKSFLLESVLRSVETESTNESKPYHLVQLDGAIQPTDRLSMRELARQLVKKGAIKMPKEGEEGALDFGLNDDEEAREKDEDGIAIDGEAVAEEEEGEGGEDDDERKAVTNAVLSSLANTTSTILTLLSTGANSKKSLPLIITLSSFDLYTSRPRQALLYVLLDAVQAGSYTPGLCVVGMTSRLDTTDLLEKRVRSRFGGRTINVWPEDVWVEVLKRTLLSGFCHDSDDQGRIFDKAWENEVDAVCSDKKVLSTLEDWKSISNVVRTLYKSIYPILASLSIDSPSLLSAFSTHQRLISSLSSYSILSDLTVPEFALLIASKQLLNRDREIFNFEMCFDELKRFVAKIEMDRLGAATTSTTIFHTPDSIPRRKGPLGIGSVGLGWQALTDRKRVMMAFRSLLQLELFQPESSLNTLTMGASLAASTAAASQKAAQTVRAEFLRVKCTIFPQDIISAAKAKNRKEALGIHLVQWATSQG